MGNLVLCWSLNSHIISQVSVYLQKACAWGPEPHPLGLPCCYSEILFAHPIGYADPFTYGTTTYSCQLPSPRSESDPSPVWWEHLPPDTEVTDMGASRPSEYGCTSCQWGFQGLPLHHSGKHLSECWLQIDSQSHIWMILIVSQNQGIHRVPSFWGLWGRICSRPLSLACRWPSSCSYGTLPKCVICLISPLNKNASHDLIVHLTQFNFITSVKILSTNKIAS